MGKVISALIIAIFWSGIVLAAEPPIEDSIRSASETPKLKLDITPINIETYTIFESKLFPGYRPCASEDYRNQDYPIFCKDEAVARHLSTRKEDLFSRNLIVDDDVVPQDNIYKLRFERFKRKKQ